MARLQCPICPRKCGNPQGLTAHIRTGHPAEYPSWIQAKRKSGADAEPATDVKPPKKGKGKNNVASHEVLESLPDLDIKVRDATGFSDIEVFEKPVILTPEQHMRAALKVLEDENASITKEIARLGELQEKQSLNQDKIDAIYQALKSAFPDHEATPPQISHHGTVGAHSSVPFAQQQH